MHAAGIVLVKNEENYIVQVVRSLLRGGLKTIVGDTGSTDRTLELVRELQSEWGDDVLRIMAMGPLSDEALGGARNIMAARARELWDIEWVFQCDGDELYYPHAVRDILWSEMPEGKRCGFTSLKTVEAGEGDEIWAINDGYSRLAVYPVGVLQEGKYPFESPTCFREKDNYHYFETGSWHGYHLHRLCRSPKDEEVRHRKEKQKQFSMMDVPEKEKRLFKVDDFALFTQKVGK